jgi:hypothetical protein
MINVCCSGNQGLTTPVAGVMGPEARALYRDIEIFTAEQGLEPPHLLSQCRSADLQRAMQQAWDTGRRSGLRVRPADPENSKHVADDNGICWAFDLSNDDTWLDIVGAWVTRTHPTATWGGIWLPKDRPHFQVEEHGRWISAASFRI